MMLDDEIRASFEKLHQEHHAKVHKYILARVKDREVAEDLTVSVFISAYRAWKTYGTGQPVPVSAWLFSIAEAACDHHLNSIPGSSTAH